MNAILSPRRLGALAALLFAGCAFGAEFVCSEASRRRAADFIENEKQFHLGFLPTEQSNPLTAGLESEFKKSALAGVECLQRADRQMPVTLRHSFASAEFRALAGAIEAVMRAEKGRVVFSGCGATGRLAIVLESMWRDFFARRGGGLGKDAAALADKAASIMTGGDFALIRSVEAFEDYASGGARQAQELGVGPDDVLVAITEGGETSSVLGTLMYAAERGAKCFLVFNNPREILRANIERSRRAIDDERVTVVDLYCGSMALAGSTRMQATSSEQLFVSAAMETALVRLFPQLAKESSVDWTEDFEQLLAQLESAGARAGIAAAIDFEEGVYREGGRITYYSDDCMLDLFTDTTERSPTFMLPPFRGTRESSLAQSWAFVKNPLYTTEACWRHLFHRAPRCLDWGPEVYRELGFPARVVAASPKIATGDFYTYQIGRENPEARTKGVGKSVAVTVTVADRPEAFLRAAQEAARAYGQSVTLHLGEGACEGYAVPIKIKRSPLEVWKHLAVKLTFNTISTGTMVRMGRVSGNWMSWVSISNKKLVDRGIRLLSELGKIPYAEAAERLFAAQEWIDAQEWGGKETPCAVQVALDWLERRGQKGGRGTEGSGLNWLDGAALPVEGRAFAETLGGEWGRLPRKYADRLSAADRALGADSCGVALRFRTDSRRIGVRWSLANADSFAQDLYMTQMAMGGIDIYEETPDGYRLCLGPQLHGGPVRNAGGETTELIVPWRPGAVAVIYLPVRGVVKSLAVGLDSGAKWEAAPHARKGFKPAVVYGTSLVHGGCVSRPGLVFTTQAARLLDLPIVNLGFSGSGRMEPVMCEILAEAEASVYVLECLGNLEYGELTARFEPFLRRLHELKPEVPILVCENINVEHARWRAFSRAVCERLKREDPAGWRNLHYLAREEQLPDDDDLTLDRCHPNDAGARFVARAYARAIGKILGL